MNDLDNWGLLRPILEGPLSLRHTALMACGPEHFTSQVGHRIDAIA